MRAGCFALGPLMLGFRDPQWRDAMRLFLNSVAVLALMVPASCGEPNVTDATTTPEQGAEDGGTHMALAGRSAFRRSYGQAE